MQKKEKVVTTIKMTVRESNDIVDALNYIIDREEDVLANVPLEFQDTLTILRDILLE